MNAIVKYKDNSAERANRVELWKRTFMKGATDDELSIFEDICNRTGLSPELKQIYPVSRKDYKTGKDVWSFQTSIDGFRLMADRTGKYSPGREPTYVYDEEKRLVSATAYIKKMTVDGTWHEVAATAFYDEYVQTFKDKDTGKPTPTQFWSKMEHNQLAKCAEALALRKAFPGDLSGIYTTDEMAQAENPKEDKKELEYITEDHRYELESIMNGDEKIEKDFLDWAQVKSLDKIPLDQFVRLRDGLKVKMKSIEAK